MLPLVRDPKGRTRGNPGGRERRLPGQAGGPLWDGALPRALASAKRPRSLYSGNAVC